MLKVHFNIDRLDCNILDTVVADEAVDELGVYNELCLLGDRLCYRHT